MKVTRKYMDKLGLFSFESDERGVGLSKKIVFSKSEGAILNFLYLEKAHGYGMEAKDHRKCWGYMDDEETLQKVFRVSMRIAYTTKDKMGGESKCVISSKCHRRARVRYNLSWQILQFLVSDFWVSNFSKRQIFECQIFESVRFLKVSDFWMSDFRVWTYHGLINLYFDGVISWGEGENIGDWRREWSVVGSK